MSGRLYTISFGGVSVSAQQDLFSINPASNRPIELHEFGVYVGGVAADAGDAQEELLRISVIRGHTTTGSAGTSATPVARKTTQSAATATCRVNDTTIASAGTAVVLLAGAFNNRVGYEKIWTPETRPGTVNANFIVVRLLSTPTDALEMSGYLLFEELA